MSLYLLIPATIILIIGWACSVDDLVRVWRWARKRLKKKRNVVSK